MASYFSVIVVDPEDWDTFLAGRESLPAVLMFNPDGTQQPSFQGAANATNQEYYHRSDAGYPPDGAATLTILINTFGGTAPGGPRAQRFGRRRTFGAHSSGKGASHRI